VQYNFSTTRILLPSTWTSIPNTTDVDGIVFEDGNIRVDMASSIYGNSPFTVHTGSCGDPGQYIQVSSALMEDIENAKDIFGPMGQVFVHEWAKYRYGVFEEHGYPGDEKYPMFYVKTIWGVNGEESILSPNFCVNTDLDYTIESIDGTTCKFDETTGLPDSHCVFVPGDTSGLRSSIMALPYIEGNDQFCDDTEIFFHDVSLPTKHNALCNMQSTFSVILQNADFSNYVQNGSSESKPTFELLCPKSSSSYVMVLDVSGSMGGERIERVKDSAVRWVTYDVHDNVPLSIVKFSSDATIIFELANITEQNRPDVVSLLRGLSAGGGTCIGDGLIMGLQALTRGGVPYGGVLLLMTDGEQFCGNGPDIPDVIDSVVEQGVRVIAIAFGSQADIRIIELAERTNGKAYFIPDGTGPEDINNALQGSLTFQPSVPSDEVDICIGKETFKNQKNITFPFFIDPTIGRDVVVQIDFSGNQMSNISIGDSSEMFTDPNGVYEKKFANLSSGAYSVNIISATTIRFASITITSKSNNDSLPIFTRCWTSIGTEQADLSLGTKIAVMAQVLQGSNPVIRAKVKAYIEREGVDTPIEVELFDKGADPDSIKDDGIYSRYFTTYDPSSTEVRYTLKCQVDSTDDSAINQGFLDARKKKNLIRGRSLPKRPSQEAPICCGSSTVNEDSVLTATGEFGGMISIVNSNQVTYPPGTVSDLVATELDLTNGTFSITFTAPGAKLDNGTVDKYIIYYTTNRTLLMTSDTFDQFDSINETQLAPGSENMSPVEAGTKIKLIVKTDHFSA
jgi:uncharacterized protein YegL